MPKAAIYDPFLDTQGGGERYCLTVAETLLKQGWNVDLFWSGDKDIIQKSIRRFSLKLDGINLVPDIFGLTTTDIDTAQEIENSKIISHKPKRTSVFEKYKKIKDYDLCFYLGDGSVPFLFSKKNIFHVQVPFSANPKLKDQVLNQIKYLLINQIVYNSKFTAKFTPDGFQSKTNILYPPVDVESFSPNPNKQNIILSVGRFDNILNSKKQDVLIDVFIKYRHQNPSSDWKLILMGGSRQIETENHYLIHLKTKAKGYPVEFIINPDFKKLQEIYSISKIYWHAAGYGVDQNKHPELCEHFGITPVEAMASGLVPILVNKGGLPEIITDSVNGYLWDKPEELLAKTQTLINTPKEFQKISQNAILTSKKFSKSIFESEILNIINSK